MCAKIVLLVEGTITYMAFIRLLSCVNFHMFIQFGFANERLLAQLTRELPYVEMSILQVFQHRGACGERCLADLAFIRLFPSVSSLVILPRAILLEPLGAVVAAIGSFVGVNPHVGPQVRLPVEGLPAHLTGGGGFPCVALHV